jgi:hypothetical protein
MNTDQLIALLSAFAAILAALYARYSINEAKRTNEISIHNEKLKIYKGILELRAKVNAHGVNIKETDLFGFYEYVQLSEFYYNKKIYNEIMTYFEEIWEIVKQKDLWEMAENQNKRKLMVSETHALLKINRERIAGIEDKMKNYLRLIET